MCVFKLCGFKEVVQQFKIRIERKTNRALNTKRSKILKAITGLPTNIAKAFYQAINPYLA